MSGANTSFTIIIVIFLLFLRTTPPRSLPPHLSSSTAKASWGLSPPTQGFPPLLLCLLFHARPPALSAKPSPGR